MNLMSDYILKQMKSMKLTPYGVAMDLGITVDDFNDCLNNNAIISEELLDRLEMYFGGSKTMWNKYRKTLVVKKVG